MKEGRNCTEKLKTYFEVYNYEIQLIKNLCDTTKAVHEEKIIVFMKRPMIWGTQIAKMIIFL